MFNFDFLKYRWICGLFSLFIFVSFIGTYFYKLHTRGYAFTYSVDFLGGTQVLLKFTHPITESQLKTILEQHNFKNPIMRNFSSEEILVRIPEVSENIAEISEKMRSSIQADLSDNTVTVLSTDSVGSGIGKMMRWKSTQAIILGLIAMLIYIWFRFWSISYGMGAVLSLFHDAVVILLICLVFDKEISWSIIGAILTILGYSINDTIVIFNKIRNNLKTIKNHSIEYIVNLSINQTLRRTILTSFATLLVIFALVIFGGSTLRDLALALMIGIIFGTYSSIYIASPIMLLFYRA